VHDAFVRSLKEAGLDNLATKLKILQDGKFAALADSQDEKMSTLLGKRSQNLDGQGDAKTSQLQRKRRREIVTGGKAQSESLPPNNAQSLVTAAQVLQKIRQEQTITYQDLASSLIKSVHEILTVPGEGTPLSPEEDKTLRRRIYDVINVLIAMGLVDKDQNMLSWTSVPNSTERDYVILDKERRDLLKRISDKRAQLRELMMQTTAVHNLAERNRKRSKDVDPENRLPLPFVVVSTNKDAIIECEVTESRTDVVLNMSEPFKVHDDTEILKRMKLHEASQETLKKLFPEALHGFIPTSEDWTDCAI